MIVVR